MKYLLIEMFALVIFIMSNEVAVVPVTWLKGKYCAWPNSKDVSKVAKTMQSPKSDWTWHEVSVKAVYESYEEARRNEKKLEDASNVETEEENLGKGERKKRKRQLSDDSSSDEELCLPISFPPVPMVVEQRWDPPVEEYAVLAENLGSSDQSTSTGDNIKPKKKSKYSTLLREILHLKLVIKEQGEMLTSILGVMNNFVDRTNSSSVVANTPLPVNLPLQSHEELLQIEEELNNDELKEKLCTQIAQTGGIHLSNTIRRMLSKLMVNEVAMQYSWIGAKGKKAFCNLKLTELIFSAVRRNRLYASATDKEIEMAIRDWLRHAKSRATYLKEN